MVEKFSDALAEVRRTNPKFFLADASEFPEAPPPVCADCRDLGFVPADAEGRMKPCVCADRKRQQVFQAALDEIFPIYSTRGFSFETYRPETDSQRAALRLCQDFVEDYPPEKGILLAGGTGLGKTCLLYLALRGALVHTVFNFERFKTTMLFSRIRSTFNSDKPGRETEYDIIRRLVAVDVLVLDDLGVEKAGEWADGILYTILDGRLEKRRPTLASTNLTGETLDQKLGHRLASRKHDLFNVVEMAGADRRVPKSVHNPASP